MELADLKRLYPCVRVSFSDDSPTGSGSRIVFIANQDRLLVGLYNTMGVFHKVKKSSILDANAFDASVEIRSAFGSIEEKKDDSWEPVGEVVKSVYNPEAPGGDLGKAFSEPMWGGGDWL